MSERDLIVRLARACAHGHRQLGFVNELLIDEGYVEAVPIPVSFGYGSASLYGDSRLSGSSFQSLRKRLTAVGFILKYEGKRSYEFYQKDKISMRFSV